MDVRALKSLYDVGSQPATPAVEQGRFAFSIDAFVARVEALVADDPCIDRETVLRRRVRPPYDDTLHHVHIKFPPDLRIFTLLDHTPGRTLVGRLSSYIYKSTSSSVNKGS
ncbi:hypothetical protein M405DRAFT_867173 [Rhizopogon salebrosus TDB-379]|nr:hypothetical protein M405DRAFT_867173 [Rhizopogon salebrosus TDB-379]